jgi:hypothetical protein
MTRSRHRLTMIMAAAAWLTTLPPTAASADEQFQTTPTTFSGQATVVRGTVAGIPITLVDTGPVDAGGGTLEAHLLCYPDGANCIIGLPNLTGNTLRAEVINAAVIAQGNHSRARASVADLSLNVAGQTIEATFIEARANAQCADGQAFIDGAATIARLVVNNMEIDVTGDVNQRVPLPGGGFVVINEQVAEMSADKGDITVRALHIVIPGPLPETGTDVVVAEAHADIGCGQRFCPRDKDFVTGGGWLSNPRRTFAVAGGFKNGAFWGHLLYVNHLTRMRAKGTGVTAYVVVDATTRHIEGTCEIDGQPGTYEADITDGGEPGVGVDRIRITLRTASSVEAVEAAMGFLSGGNFQLHTCK